MTGDEDIQFSEFINIYFITFIVFIIGELKLSQLNKNNFVVEFTALF